jgi:hypothetical protein
MQASLAAFTSVLTVFFVMLCISWVSGKLLSTKDMPHPPIKRILRNLLLVFLISFVHGVTLFPGIASLVAIACFLLTISSLADLCILMRIKASKHET